MTELAITSALLTGFVNPIGLTPAFFEPVFVSAPFANEFYLQDIDRADNITQFIPGVADDEDIIQIEPLLEKRIGEPAIYAFSRGPGYEILVNERPKLAEGLLADLAAYIDRPALTIDLLEFCFVRDKLREPRQQAFLRLEECINHDAAKAWRDTQILLPLIRRRIEQLLSTLFQPDEYSPYLQAIYLQARNSSKITINLPVDLDRLLDATGQRGPDMYGHEVLQALSDFDLTGIETALLENATYSKSREHDRLEEPDPDKYPEVINDALAHELLDLDHFPLNIVTDGTLEGLGKTLGRIVQGKSILHPSLQLFFEQDLPNELTEKVKERFETWFSQHMHEVLGPLLDLEDATDLTTNGRRLANILIKNVGVLNRTQVKNTVTALSQDERKIFRSYGIRFGAHHIFTYGLLKPTHRMLAAQLYMTMHGGLNANALEELRSVLLSGSVRTPVNPKISRRLYEAIGFAVYGPMAIRVDMVERLLDMIRATLLWRENSLEPKPDGAIDGTCFVVTVAMVSLVGSIKEEFPHLLQALGYGMERRSWPKVVAGTSNGDSTEIEVWRPIKRQKSVKRPKR
jgi:hypothetical protein